MAKFTSQVHGATVLLLGLMTTAVPALLVAHCLARVPLLRDVELVGGTYFPSVSTASRDGGREGIPGDPVYVGDSVVKKPSAVING